MTENLRGQELAALIVRVFQPTATERSIGVLVDLPDEQAADSPAWKSRREMAVAWVHELDLVRGSTGIEPVLVMYRNVHANNAQLPDECWVGDSQRVHAGPIPTHASALETLPRTSFRDVLTAHPLFLAPTQFSATAPLKLSAPAMGFRAATMPGFSREMIPALRLDYVEINRRCMLLKRLLDASSQAHATFLVDGTRRCELWLDLRHRLAHASGGLLPAPGTAGNLPSGETYIVPYEGELDGDPSLSHGTLPVQLGDAVLLYQVEQNRARSVECANQSAGEAESTRLRLEPAYGNIAELGLGVLEAFGVQPTGEILLDEKLGLHIAFGRSDHFGGQVGPGDFSSPDAVVHIDRVYVPRLQPRVHVESLDLQIDGNVMPLMRDGQYCIDFAQ